MTSGGAPAPGVAPDEKKVVLIPGAGVSCCMLTYIQKMSAILAALYLDGQGGVVPKALRHGSLRIEVRGEGKRATISREFLERMYKKSAGKPSWANTIHRLVRVFAVRRGPFHLLVTPDSFLILGDPRP